METTGVIAIVLCLGVPGAIFLAFAEKIVPVLPSHVMLLLLGTTVASGTVSLTLLIAATALGSTAGSWFWYRVGRRLGERRAEAFVTRFGRYLFFSTATFGRLTAAYRNNHLGVTFAGQLVPTVRIYLALPAGALGLPPRPFLLASLLGSLVWNALFLTVGYTLLSGSSDPVGIGLRIVVLVVLVEAALLLAVRYGAAWRAGMLHMATILRPRRR